LEKKNSPAEAELFVQCSHFFARMQAIYSPYGISAAVENFALAVLELIEGSFSCRYCEPTAPCYSPSWVFVRFLHAAEQTFMLLLYFPNTRGNSNWWAEIPIRRKKEKKNL